MFCAANLSRKLFCLLWLKIGTYSQIMWMVGEALWQSGTTFTKPYFLRNLRMSPKARVLHYIKLPRFSTDKHSSLLDQFISYEKKEVLWISPQIPNGDFSVVNVQLLCCISTFGIRLVSLKYNKTRVLTYFRFSTV